MKLKHSAYLWLCAAESVGFIVGNSSDDSVTIAGASNNEFIILPQSQISFVLPRPTIVTLYGSCNVPSKIGTNTNLKFAVFPDNCNPSVTRSGGPFPALTRSTTTWASLSLLNESWSYNHEASSTATVCLSAGAHTASVALQVPSGLTQTYQSVVVYATAHSGQCGMPFNSCPRPDGILIF